MSLLAVKVATQLLLPPGGLILAGALGLAFWRKWQGRALTALALALLWGLTLEPVRDALTRPLEYRYPPLDARALPGGPLVIVLLGGGIYEDAPEYGGRDELGRHALMRTVYAADLARATGLPVYATGGQTLTHASTPSGEIMRRWLIRLGVPARLAHAENAADNTWQNAAFVRRLLAASGVRRVVLVTSAWHMPRAVWCFERNGLRVIPAPTDYLSRRSDYDVRSWFPSWGAFADSCDALHEYLGMLWYRLRYGWHGDGRGRKT